MLRYNNRGLFNLETYLSNGSNLPADYMFYYSKTATHVSPSSFLSFQYLEDRSHYPVSLKFGRPRVTTNEKIVLASMFYPLYALAVQLSPDTGSSGIQVGGIS